MSTDLEARVEGPVLIVGDDGYDADAIGHNTAAVPVAEIIVGARSASDVQAAVRHAANGAMRVAVLATGHGPIPPPAQMLINTSRLQEVTIDPVAKTATVGAGVQWKSVYPAAAEHGLAPITGSSTNVGVVGYLLGGGMGPLARSHGMSSDYITSIDVVTGDGELRRATTEENADLFWALRGGKAGLGVVTSVTIRLVELETLYAGSLMFDTPDIEAALRGWVSWVNGDPDPRVTTSVMIARMPPFDEVPEPLRGRHVLSIRFAFPGDAEEGERLAEPLRAVAPVFIDDLAQMQSTEMARISNDPDAPGPSWISARLLDRVDDEWATRWLSFFGPEAEPPPFVGVETRQLGGALADDVPEGSAAGGRQARFSIGMVGVDPTLFGEALPAKAGEIYESIAAYLSADANANFCPAPKTLEEFEATLPAGSRERLRAIRAEYDPDGVIALWE
jgi:FAD/FMN-containing dehydrogenase